MSADDELLAAYVDGVSELTPAERRRVEARIAEDPALRLEEQATRDVLGQLRELSPEGDEPDWAAMERAISAEVGPTVPRPWWRPAWRWLVPVAAVALAGAVLALWLRGPAPIASEPVIARRTSVDAGAVAAEPAPTVPLWLDGAQYDVDMQADELLGMQEDESAPDDDSVDGLLPTTNLAAVDELNTDQAERLEQWLARRKKS